MTLTPPDGYTLDRRLGAGSSGTVWLAMDNSLNRTVALKLVPRDRNSNGLANRERPGHAASRLAEGRVLASLQNQHVARVFDITEDEHGTWLIMEYVPGPTLQDVLDAPASIEIHRATHWCAQLADALVALANLGVVHSDVKPANVIVWKQRHCRLVDFGLAQVRSPSDTPLGTPACTSPEQANGQSGTPASDVYSLGVVAYWLLAGQHPFEFAAGDSDRMIEAHRTVRPKPARSVKHALPASLSRTLGATLRKDPRRRPSAIEFRGRLISEMT